MYSKPLLGNYVTLYGICIAIGILVCILVLRWLGKKTNVDKKFLDFVETTAYVAILLGFFFAKLFQAFYDFIDSGTFDFMNAGITFIGGLIGGAGTFIAIYMILRKKLTGKIVDVLPIIPCSIAVAHAFGRIGCFFAGCCGGRKVVEGDFFYFLALNFPGEGLVYPTQLFEAFFLFVLFGVLLFLVLKKDFKYGFSIYLGAYGVWRFFLEFLRDDYRGELVPGLTPSQFWSILMVLGALPVYFLIKHLLKTRNESKEAVIVEETIEDSEDVIETPEEESETFDTEIKTPSDKTKKDDENI